MAATGRKFVIFSHLGVVLITCKENQLPITKESCKNLASGKESWYVKHGSKQLGKNHLSKNDVKMCVLSDYNLPCL